MLFKRSALAKSLSDELLGKSLLSTAPSGLFLSAPRRTGKTYFLRFDLLPQLQAEGILAIYVDLWENPDRSPMEVVASGLAEAVQDSLGWIAQAAVATGAKKFKIPGIDMEFDISRVGRTDGMSLKYILSQIYKQSGKRIALIIDEAQHALTSDDGESLMTALKSARDQMKDRSGSNLLLIMSGSHRDKLMGLLDSAAAPFWGAEVRTLPTLGREYAEQYANEIKLTYPKYKDLNLKNFANAFELVGERPEFFQKLIRAAAESATTAEELDQTLAQLAPGQEVRDRAAITHLYSTRTKLEQAVLRRMAEQGEQFKAYDNDALNYFAQAMGESVTVSQVQVALDALRDPHIRLVWKSLRAGYALYDHEMYNWYSYLKNAMKWPPVA